MRKVLPALLIGLGAFLVSIALVALLWAPGQIERTPLDTDSLTELSGEAAVLGGEPGPVKAFSSNKVDSEASDDEVAVWVTWLCLVDDIDDPQGCVGEDDPQGRLISAEETLFATDRHTGMTVDNGDYLPADTPQQEGLQNKWPFNAEKKTYPVWDDIVGAAVDAEYIGEETIDGLDVYVYEYTTNVGPVNLVMDINGTYFATYTFYVEPKTGQIMKQVIHQERIQAGVETVLELDLEFTEDQVASNVADAKDSLSQLRLIEVIIPIVGFAVGIPLVLIGVVLLLRRRGSAPARAEASSEKVSTDA